MNVHLVWHVRHARNLDGSPTEHRDPDGGFTFDEEFDDLKIIGIYADEPLADAAIARAKLLPGFQDEPECFMVDRFTVGQDLWTEGFVSEPVPPSSRPKRTEPSQTVRYRPTSPGPNPEQAQDRRRT